MKVLLAAINAKYIHSNLGIYSLKTYGEKMLKEWGLAEQAEISLAEYTINHQMEQILQDIYKRKPDVIGFSCYIWNISYVKMILADIKKVLPDVKIWAGGPEAVSYTHLDVYKRQAPSANTSGRPSPTTADHVWQDLNGKIEMIIDGCLLYTSRCV